MKILLRENDGRIWALDPNTGEKLERINPPNTCAVGEYCQGGLWWNSWEEARRYLHEHEIIIGDDPTEKPVIIGRASFNPADTAAEDMTIRQVYKCSAIEALITAKYPGCGVEDRGRKMLAIEVGELADAMIEEDKQHEAKGK